MANPRELALAQSVSAPPDAPRQQAQRVLPVRGEWRLLSESRSPQEQQALWVSSTFLTEPNWRVQISLHPESRAYPPSVSHFPAAVE